MIDQCLILLLIPAALGMGTAAPGERKDADENVKKPELRKELLRRKDQEQALRFKILSFIHSKGISSGRPIADPKVAAAFKEIQARLEREDAQNRQWLKEIVDKSGWPGKSMVGKDGAAAAWLLVQHADPDRPFQKHCLVLMKAMPPGEVELPNIAYLTDRVLVGEKKKQLYGTQLQANDKGQYVPLPIEDEAHVDQRRRDMGMEPLANYLKMANQQLKKKG